MLRLVNEGARPQRLLWASTGTKDPNASDTLYIEAFASPFTVNTMPEPTLHAFAEHGEIGEPVPADGGNAEQVLAEFEAAGIDVAALADAPAGRGQRELQQVLGRAAGVDLLPARGDGGVSRAGAGLRRAARLGRPPGPLREDRRRPPARPLRRRPRARRAPGRRRRRPLPRLLQEPDHRRDAAAARRAGPRSAASRSAAKRCSPASTSTSPRTAPCSTWRCGCRASAR